MEKVFGGRKFIRYAVVLAIPSMLQQIVSSFAQLVDNVMVGKLGNETVAAVGVANQIAFIMFFVAFGLSSACGIFISQYMGTNNGKKVQEVFRINIIFAMLFGIMMFIVINTVPERLVEFFVKDNVETVRLAVLYLQKVSPVYIIFPLVITYSFGFRYEGKPKYGMIMSIIAVTVNTLLNYCLIYGNFGFKAYGVAGAAYATVIARVVELCVGLVFSIFLNTNIYTKVSHLFKFEFKLFKTMVSKGWLIIANEVIWSTAMIVLNIFYSAKVSDNITALQINGVMLSLAFVGSGGIATAIGVIVGNELGKDNLVTAKKDSIYLIRLSGVFAFGIGILLIIISPFFPKLYNVSEMIASDASKLILISGIFISLRYVEMATFFVVRSGGDTRGIFLMDAGYMWIVCLPLMYLVSHTDTSMIERVIIGNFIFMPKLLLTYFIYRKGTWLKNITV